MNAGDSPQSMRGVATMKDVKGDNNVAAGVNAGTIEVNKDDSGERQ